MFNNAIVRKPGRDFADGLTTRRLAAPIYERPVEQHLRYCEALERCGLRLTMLEAYLPHPDATFVEDTAVLTLTSAILTRSGARSRKGEVAGIREPLGRFFRTLHPISAPGTLDGGDICEAENRFFIGISPRRNEDGGRQLAGFLAPEDYTSSFVDIRGMNNILHLKSGVAYNGDNNLVATEELSRHAQFSGYNLIRVNAQASYAANCLHVNERVFIPP